MNEGQFKIPGFTSPFRRDRNEFRSGIMVFVRVFVNPSKVISKETLMLESHLPKKFALFTSLKVL